MVTKVKENRMNININFPPDSQNSASPYARTVSELMTLHILVSLIYQGKNLVCCMG